MKRATKKQKERALNVLRGVLIFHLKGLEGFADELREDGLPEEAANVEKLVKEVDAMVDAVDRKLS